MTYMLLIVEQPGERNVDPKEGQRRYEVMQGFAADLDARGLLTRRKSLLTTEETGVRVRHRDGKNATVDGPFAEAKEIIGGFFLLKVEDPGRGGGDRRGMPGGRVVDRRGPRARTLLGRRPLGLRHRG